MTGSTLELAAFTGIWDQAGGWTAVLDADTFTVAVEGDGGRRTGSTLQSRRADS